MSPVLCQSSVWVSPLPQQHGRSSKSCSAPVGVPCLHVHPSRPPSRRENTLVRYLSNDSLYMHLKTHQKIYRTLYQNKIISVREGIYRILKSSKIRRHTKKKSEISKLIAINIYIKFSLLLEEAAFR